MARKKDFIITPSTDNDLLFFPTIDGEKKGMGLIPRDFDKDPPKMRAVDFPFPLMDDQEIKDRIKEQEKYGTHNEAILRQKKIPSTNQRSDGYCWFYSGLGAVIVNRAKQNQPYVSLNGHSGASIIKKGRNEGGWSGTSGEWIVNNGIVPTSMWPEGSRDYQRYWTPEAKAEAKKYASQETYIDLGAREYDRNMTDRQINTLLALGIPCQLDYNEWGHSIVGVRLVILDGEIRKRIRNSWTDRWGDLGFATMQRWDVDGCVGHPISGVAA